MIATHTMTNNKQCMSWSTVYFWISTHNIIKNSLHTYLMYSVFNSPHWQYYHWWNLYGLFQNVKSMVKFSIVIMFSFSLLDQVVTTPNIKSSWTMCWMFTKESFDWSCTFSSRSLVHLHKTNFAGSLIIAIRFTLELSL